MAILLNRKYGSRLECLYYILKSCYAKYGVTNNFCLNDLKFDCEDEYNVHNYCQLTIDLLGNQCCPFLVNPLDSSKCYATQSIESDSTKSKAVSDIGGSLEALGFIRRVQTRTYRITDLGESWVKTDFFSSQWEEIARQGVLSYGVVVGFLSLLRTKPIIFSSSDIYLGYPKTEETVCYVDEHSVAHITNISTGSEPDSVTRTKSRVIGWCISVGLIEPADYSGKADTENLAHLKYRDFLNQRELTVRYYKKTDLFKEIFSSKIFVSNPLAYSRLHKSVKSMRENGGEILRMATMECNDKILNRRFVFAYVLNYFSQDDKEIDFNLLVSTMTKYGQFFFTPNNDIYQIMSSESQIADMAGIPFEEKDGYLVPLTIINESVLCEDAPREIVTLAKTIVKEMESK